VIDVVVAGIAAFSRAMTSVAPAATLWQREGVVAAAFPRTPDRSFLNAVAYDDPDALRAAVPELAAFYEEHGVRAWTVWVPEGDTAVATTLEQAGHALDGVPRAMALDLGDLRVPGDGLDWEESADVTELITLNAAAYGWGPDELTMSALPVTGRVFYAHADGERRSTLMTVDHGEDAMVSMVATAEEARGRGIASRLMSEALLRARQRGQRTSTLQATKAGTPIYARLGYRDLGAIQMWERRRAGGPARPAP
jgi:GNAT superfamily N-acetyltransferase